MSSTDKPISQEAAQAMLAALRQIAGFPNDPDNRDMSFSEAVSRMADIAYAAIRSAEAVR